MQTKSILIVDDSEIVAQRLLLILKGSDGNGHAIRHAGDFPDAVRLLAESHPDIVLLDIHLHVRSGIELLQYIKINYPATIVIMLTNESGDYYKKTCKNLGAAYFIDKSKEFELVTDIISSIP
jgi:CheY-like chemotaxis protein